MLRELTFRDLRHEEELTHGNWRYGGCFLSLCIACSIPSFAPELSGFASIVLLYTLLATGLGLELRLAGLPDFAYASWFAIGGYSGGLLTRYSGLPFWAGLPLAMFLAALVAVSIASPLLRRRIELFGILALGFGAALQIVLADLEPPPIVAFPSIPASLEYWSLVLATVVTTLVAYGARRSPLARLLRAARQDEIASHSIGVDLRSCRLAVLAIGAAIAGASGCLFAAGQGSVGPTDFDLSVIAVPFAIAVLGGSQGQFGIIAAAIVLAAILRLFPELPEYRLLISGTTLICWAIWRATPQSYVPSTEHKAKTVTEAEIGAE